MSLCIPLAILSDKILKWSYFFYDSLCIVISAFLLMCLKNMTYHWLDVVSTNVASNFRIRNHLYAILSHDFESMIHNWFCLKIVLCIVCFHNIRIEWHCLPHLHWKNMNSNIMICYAAWNHLQIILTLGFPIKSQLILSFTMFRRNNITSQLL